MSRQATAVTIASVVVTPLAGGLAVLGGIGSFTTIRHLAYPWFGQQSWIIPVGIDIGILALLAWDLLDECVGFPWAPLRWTAWFFIAATVYLNIAAAHGNPAAAIMHAAMPVLFVTVIEGIRHLIRQAVGLGNGTRIEHIPATRWLLAPRSSFLLFRHMTLWHVTSYRNGLLLEHQRLVAIAQLQQVHGHYLWRWRAPLKDRLALRLAPVPASIEVGTRAEPIRTENGPSDKDRRLIEAARAIVRDSNSKGTTLSQAALGRALREQGLSVANERLRWLLDAVGTYPQERGPHS